MQGWQAVKAVSEPTCSALSCKGAICLRGVGTYLLGTVLQGCRLLKHCVNLSGGRCVAGCRLFKRCQNLPPKQCGAAVQAVKVCQNLPPMHSGAGVHAVLALSKPTCRALCCRGAGCLSSVETYQPGIVLQRCRLFQRCQNLIAGTVLQGAGCLSGGVQAV